MKNRRLKDGLQLLVGRYGFRAVDLELRRLEPGRRPALPTAAREGDAAKSRRKRGRVTAPEYVRKMDVDAGKRAAVSVLAERFEAKSFLPRCADIDNFCNIHGIDEPASKSRAGAIPRLFKHLAAMDAQDVQRLVDENAFSGPSRLGPLADAIRMHGRVGRSRSADAPVRG